MWFHSKDVVTVGIGVIWGKRREPRPLCHYYYIIKSNNSNSLGEVTACILDRLWFDETDISCIHAAWWGARLVGGLSEEEWKE